MLRTSLSSINALLKSIVQRFQITEIQKFKKKIRNNLLATAKDASYSVVINLCYSFLGNAVLRFYFAELLLWVSTEFMHESSQKSSSNVSVQQIRAQLEPDQSVTFKKRLPCSDISKLLVFVFIWFSSSQILDEMTTESRIISLHKLQ